MQIEQKCLEQVPRAHSAHLKMLVHKPKIISLLSKRVNKKLKIITFKKLEPVGFWPILLKNKHLKGQNEKYIFFPLTCSAI